MERHAIRTQLEGLREVLDVANVEHHSIQVQLEGICNAFEYVAGLMYKAYIGSRINAENERGEGSSQDVERWGTRKGEVRNGEEPGGGGDQGVNEVVGEPRVTDKGKGKMREVVEEGTLQEGLEQQDV